MTRPRKNDFLEMVQDIKSGTVEARDEFTHYDIVLISGGKELLIGTTSRVEPYSRHDSYQRIINIVAQYQKWFDGNRKITKSKTSTKLSPTQRDCLSKLEKHGMLHRHVGGCWAALDVPMKAKKLGRRENDVFNIPEWYFETSTIKALISRGLAIVTETKTNGHSTYPVTIKAT